MARISRYDLISSSIGAILHVLFVAIPKDLWRWRHLTPKDVRDKTIVITGAASGLGKAMAELFAIEHGAKVAIVDINEEGAAETVKTITERNGIARSWICDISKAEQMDKCAEEIRSEFGQVDIVICNAVVLFFGYALQLSASQLQKSVDVNIMGTINTIRAFLGQMEERNQGQIVAMSSIAGYYGETNGLAYCPTKFAIRGIMECVQMEMRDRGLNGIRFTTINPYFTRTPMILNMNMRPTSLLFPFMSVARCSREIVDAILKEKITAFIPGYISVISALKNLTSNKVRMAVREYLNCRYEPTTKHDLGKNELMSTAKNNDYFHSLDLLWKWLIPLPLTALTVCWISGQLSLMVFVLAVLIALIQRSFSAICVLYLCDQLSFSFTCTYRWFMQSALFGLPSFLTLLHYRNKML